MKPLKSVFKFWQEIIFIVSTGSLLIGSTRGVINSQSMDIWDILLVCWVLPLFICLIGQFFWKKKSLAIILSVPLGLSSVITIFMALYGIFNSPSYRTESIAMLIIGTVLVLAALKMLFKYDVNKVHVES